MHLTNICCRRLLCRHVRSLSIDLDRKLEAAKLAYPVPPLAASKIPYFAYGANLSHQRMLDRGIPITLPGQPAVVISDLSLSFSHRGAFATLTKDAAKDSHSSCTLTYTNPHGVFYYLSKQDLDHLSGLETGYKLVQLEIELYNERILTASTFVSRPALRLQSPLPPTARYLDLMITGARQHHLSVEYIAWLKGIQPHKGGPLGEEYFKTPSVAYTNTAFILLGLAAMYICLQYGR